MSGNFDGEPTTYYVISISAGPLMNVMCLSPMEVTSASEFMQLMESLEDASLYMQEGPEGGWNEEMLDENGVLDFDGDRVTIGISSSVQSFVNTFAYESFTPAKIGSLSKAINGELQPLITASEMPSTGAKYMYLYTGNFSWNDSVSSPFNFFGTVYQIRPEDRNYNVISLDPNKDYEFDVMVNDPVWFANEGFVITQAWLQDKGDSYGARVSFEARRINNNSDNYIYIKITEKGGN